MRNLLGSPFLVVPKSLRFGAFWAVHPHNSGVLGSRRCDEQCCGLICLLGGTHWRMGMQASNLLPTNWQLQTHRASTETIKSAETALTSIVADQTRSFMCWFATPPGTVRHHFPPIWLISACVWLFVIRKTNYFYSYISGIGRSRIANRLITKHLYQLTVNI